MQRCFLKDKTQTSAVLNETDLLAVARNTNATRVAAVRTTDQTKRQKN
jgi:hypothetical protein